MDFLRILDLLCLLLQIASNNMSHVQLRLLLRGLIPGHRVVLSGLRFITMVVSVGVLFVPQVNRKILEKPLENVGGRRPWMRNMMLL